MDANDLVGANVKEISDLQNRASKLINLYKEYQQIKQVKAYCSKKIDEGYICKDCRQHPLSVICAECFDFTLHKQHNFYFVSLKTIDSQGTCDCGNKKYLCKDGFCDKHKMKKIETESKKGCVDDTVYFIKILYEWQNNSKQNLNKVDQLGESVLKEINKSNCNRWNIKRMTIQSFKKQIQVTRQINKLFSCTVLDCIIQLTKLPKTLTQFQTLFGDLLQPSLEFEKTFTLFYIKNYNKIVLTNFRKLSNKILSSSMILCDIMKNSPQNEKPLFVLSLKSDDFMQKDLLKGVSQIVKAYRIYLDDLQYLINQNQKSAVSYWYYFALAGGFKKITNYCQAFKGQYEFKQANKNYFNLQSLPIQRTIQIFSLIESSKEERIYFFKKVMFDLFQIITVEQQNRVENNLFLVNERMWTLCVYIFLHRKEGQKSQENSTDLYFQLYKQLNIKTPQQAEKKLLILFERVLNFWSSNCLLYYMDQNSGLINDVNQNNISKSNLLFSIDAILLQIIIKMISQLSKIKDQVSLEKVNDLIIKKVEQLSQNILSKYNKIEEHNNFTNEMKKQIISGIRRLLMFSSQLLQALYSDLPDLVLSSKFKHISQRPTYQKKYIAYYYNLLASAKADKIQVGKFKQIVKKLLFDENVSLQKFLSETKCKQQSDKDFLSIQKCQEKGRRIDILFHFNQLKQELMNQEISRLFYMREVLKLPFQQSTKTKLYHLTESNLYQKLYEIVQNMINHKQIGYQNKLAQNQIKIEEAELYLQKALRTNRYDHQRLLAYKIIENLWKISYYAGKMKQFTKTQKIMYQSLSSQNNRTNSQKQNLEMTYYFLSFLEPQFKQSFIQFKQKYQQQYSFGFNSLTNQKIQQSDQRSDYNQFSSQQNVLPDNINESMSQRIQQNSFSSEQIAEEKHRPIDYLYECSICKQRDIYVHQVYYLSRAFPPPFIQVDQKFKANYYSSCEHFFHKKCLENLKKKNQEAAHQQQSKEDNKIKKCKICDSRYHRSTPNDDKIDLSSSNQQQKTIIRMFQSIIVYILTVSVKEKISSQQQPNQITYKRLVSLLKVYSRKMKKILTKEAILSQMSLFKKYVESQSIVNYLTQFLGQQIIKIRGFDSASIKEVKISQVQAQNINIMIKRLLHKNDRIPISPSIQFKDLSQTVSDFLPKNLRQLSLWDKICKCGIKERKIQLLFLTPTNMFSGNFDFRCYFCKNLYIKTVLQENKNFNQILALNVDTGKITYYTKSEGQIWLMHIETKYIYRNKQFKQISLNIKQFITDTPDKLTYNLNTKLFGQILGDFYAKKFLISKDLKEFLIN